MDPEIKPIKRKRNNFLTRFSHRVSRFFSRKNNAEGNLKRLHHNSNSQSVESQITSKSHDNLNKIEKPCKKTRKKYGFSLMTSSKKERCLSEGNLAAGVDEDGGLTDDELKTKDPFYSNESLTKSAHVDGRSGTNRGKHVTGRQSKIEMAILQLAASNNNTNYNNSQFNNDARQFISSTADAKAKLHFKSELAKKLHSKSPQHHSNKDNDSELSKTPESPIDTTSPHTVSTGETAGVAVLVSTSPSRAESQTPRSLSSLSQSTNSLLSGGGNSGLPNCNTSGNNQQNACDTESMMSRSVIEGSNEDQGIIIDLNTPISKTTNASLLDSTAARSKIAASRQRRTRATPAVSTKTSSGNNSSINSGFPSSTSLPTDLDLSINATINSLDKKELVLEEIVEEDSFTTFNNDEKNYVPYSNKTKNESLPMSSSSSVEDLLVPKHKEIPKSSPISIPNVKPSTKPEVKPKSPIQTIHTKPPIESTKEPKPNTNPVVPITLRKTPARPADSTSKSDVDTVSFQQIKLRPTSVITRTAKSTNSDIDDIPIETEPVNTNINTTTVSIKVSDESAEVVNQKYESKVILREGNKETESNKKSEEVGSSGSTVNKFPTTRYLSMKQRTTNTNNDVQPVVTRTLNINYRPVFLRQANHATDTNKRSSRVLDMVKNMEIQQHFPDQ